MQDLYTKEDILSKIALADLKTNQEEYKEVIEIYKNIIENSTDSSHLVNVYNKLGNIYYKINDFDNAIQSFEKVLNYCSNNANIYNMLGYLYFYKDIDKSIKYYLKGMELKPDINNFVFLTHIMIKSIEYSQKDLKTIFEKYVDYFRPLILNSTEPFCYDNKNFDKNKKLKIGYFSSNFFCHPTMSFVLPIIENHDLDKFDIVLYSCSDNKDFITERLIKTGVEYKTVSGLTNEKIAKTINKDEIDILVDLTGYSHSEQAIWTLLFKPAPIIIQGFGFLGTYGIKEVDYILTDKFTIPWGTEKYYTEKPMYIKSGMNRFTFLTGEQHLPQITPIPYEQNEYITFGSFNSISKINTYTLNLWSEVLKAVPNSKLLIYRTQMEEKDIVRFKKVFDANGIEPERIIFDSRPTPESHMNSYLKCDIALDPMPFSGLTTTLEQAFMGIPTLTMPKDTMASKGTARINKMLGLNEFIAKNEKDYIKKAIKLAHNIEKLRYYRQNLPTIVENSPLCDNFKEYVKQIENEYKKAWKKFCN